MNMMSFGNMISRCGLDVRNVDDILMSLLKFSSAVVLHENQGFLYL